MTDGVKSPGSGRFDYRTLGCQLQHNVWTLLLAGVDLQNGHVVITDGIDLEIFKFGLADYICLMAASKNIPNGGLASPLIQALEVTIMAHLLILCLEFWMGTRPSALDAEPDEKNESMAFTKGEEGPGRRCLK